MLRNACSVVLLALLSMPMGCARADEKKAPGLDPVRFERFLRRYFNWPETVKVTVGPFKPAAVPGLLETSVKLSQGQQTQTAEFLVTPDGQFLVQGPAVNMGADPFASNREKMDLKNMPSLGSPLAPVTVVEYSDFQCPYCRMIAPVLKDQLVPQMKQEVRLVWKDYPLASIHPWATSAAEFGRCVYKRYSDDGFWAFHDWAFSHQGEIKAENFKQKALDFAKSKGFDSGYLGTCMDQADVKQEVTKSVDEAESLGVTGTPTMFMNGRKLVGNLPLDQLKKLVVEESSVAQGK